MKPSYENYRDSSEEELILDEFFVQSTRQPTTESEAFWNGFLSAYPDKKSIVEAARSFVRDIRFKTDIPQSGVKEKTWNAITEKTEGGGKVVSIYKQRRWWWAAAAISSVFLISAVWFFTQGNQKNNTTINSQYAELKKVILPDQSVVTLNANSSLEYKKEWKEGQVREVWIKGEGFFEVKHLNSPGQPITDHERFIVHSDGMRVEVLGTAFSVSDRKEISKVALQTGSVRIDFDDNKTQSIVLIPGEMLSYNHQTGQVTKETAEVDKVVSWTNKELYLDNTTMTDIINVIENTYGYKVEIDDKEILNRQLSGTGKLSLENEKTLFKAIEILLNVELVINDKTIIIKER